MKEARSSFRDSSIWADNNGNDPESSMHMQKKTKRLWKRKAGFFRRLVFSGSGAVTMEYVLLCVLIAGGAVMMVVTFSRAVTKQFALMSYVMAPLPDEDFSAIQQRFRDDTDKDAKVGSQYSDYIHGVKGGQE